MKHYTQEELLRYLSGSFTPQEVKALNGHLRICNECNALLEAEIELDIALIDAKQEPDETIIPSAEIETMISRAVTETENIEAPKRKSYLFLWAIAAALLIAFTFSRFKDKHTQPSPVVAVDVPVKAIQMREPPKSTPVVFGKKTHAIASKSANLRIISKSEEEAVAALDSGSALFSVEPNRYASFVVETPDAEITVTGTLFDVWISNGSTKVTVLKGKVIVNYRNLKESVAVPEKHISVIEEGRVEVKTSTENDTKGLPSYSEMIPVTAKELSAEIVTESPVAQIDVWNSKLNEAISLSDNRSYQQAFNAYLEIIDAKPGNRNEEIARFEAASLLINQLGRRQDGIKALEEYLETFKRGVFEEEALLEILKLSRGNVSNLYNNTIRFISKYSDHPYARRAAYEHATLLREAGHYSAAASLYGQFVQLWPRDNRSEDALYWQGKAFMSAGDSLSGRKIMATYTEKYPEGRWIKETNR
jgi:hypothetical protein